MLLQSQHKTPGYGLTRRVAFARKIAGTASVAYIVGGYPVKYTDASALWGTWVQNTPLVGIDTSADMSLIMVAHPGGTPAGSDGVFQVNIIPHGVGDSVASATVAVATGTVVTLTGIAASTTGEWTIKTWSGGALPISGEDDFMDIQFTREANDANDTIGQNLYVWQLFLQYTMKDLGS